MVKTVNLSLPEELLDQIDLAAKADYASRSDFIRETLVRRLNGQRIIDEWGDAVGKWDNSIDIRDEQGNGVAVGDVLEILDSTKDCK